jgi:hypothetical protein
MPVTVEQNTALKRSVRNDLRYIISLVPLRWFSERAPWSPSVVGSVFPPKPGDIPGPPAPPAPVVVVSHPLQTEKIDIATAATHVIIPGAPGRRIRIMQIFFTVGGEVNITLYNGVEAMTGAMDFGGASEPRAIVIPNDGRPLMLDEGAGFLINLSAAVQVSGLVNYRYV